MFSESASVILAITGIAKIISGFGRDRVLEEVAPFFFITLRSLLWIVGGMELIVGCVCLGCKRREVRAWLIAWMATNIWVYRLGLLWIGYQKPCGCLGNVTGALHLPSQTADAIMKVILAYLLIGSYATLIWLEKRKRKPAIASGGISLNV